MANDKTTLVAVYDDYQTAEKAETALIGAGFDRSNVDVNANSGSRTTTETSDGGGVSGFFHRLFGGDSEAGEHTQYAEAVRQGNAVLTATVPDDEIESATDILNRYDPIDFDQRVGGTSGTSSIASRTSGDERAIPVVEEELQVGKRTVQRGGVRVYTRVTETPVSENVTLREERATVTRRPVDRAATEADFRAGDSVIEVVETAEEAVVGKRARVVEEVVVGRESSERTQAIHDTVRRTDVQVERIDPQTDADFRSDYQTRYGSDTGSTYDTYGPAYEYGYSSANDPRYRGKSFDDVESTVKTDYLRNNPNSAWDRTEGAVRYGWEKATGKR